MKFNFGYLPIAFAASCFTLPGSAAAQSVISGQLLTSTIDVTATAAAPLIALRIKGSVPQVNLSYTGPSGQLFNQSFNDFNGTFFTGKVDFQGFNSGYGAGAQTLTAFSLYTQPGKWHLTSLSVCGTGFPCASYTGHALSVLFGGTLSFQIVNPNPFDIEPPKALAGSFLTPTVSISAGTMPQVSMRVSDNFSGVGEFEVCSSVTPSNANSICFFYYNPPKPLKAATVTATGYLQANMETGTYTVTSISVFDIAGNVRSYTDASTISQMFGGKPSFTVTQ